MPQEPNGAHTRTASSTATALREPHTPHSTDRSLSPSSQHRASSGAASALHASTGQHSSKAAAAGAVSSTAVHHLLRRGVAHAQQPHAHGLKQQTAMQKKHAVNSSEQQFPLETVVADHASVVDALLKYNFYKTFGIDLQHVAPYREKWIQAAVALLPLSVPSHVSQVCSHKGWNGSPHMPLQCMSRYACQDDRNGRVEKLGTALKI